MSSSASALSGPAVAISASSRSNIPAYVALGLGGAGLIAGTVFGISALTNKADFERAPPGTDPAMMLELADATDRNALLADISFAVGLTFGVTGIVLLVANSEKPDPAPASPATKPGSAVPSKPQSRQPSLRVLPYAGPQGGGLSATVTW